MLTRYQVTYYCYLIATIAHNPAKGGPPVVLRVQMASSEYLSALFGPREHQYMQAVLMKTASPESYGEAQKAMIAYVRSFYCPTWVRDMLPLTDDLHLDLVEDRMRYIERLERRDASEEMTLDMLRRPLVTQGGVA